MSDEEDAVVEMESEIDYAAERSAAWRDVAREGIAAVNRVAFFAWLYLMVRLGVELFIGLMR